MAQANPPQPEQNDLTGSQLATVRNYTGSDQDDVEIWIAHVSRIPVSYTHLTLPTNREV